jgi:hypothetical protein
MPAPAPVRRSLWRRIVRYALLALVATCLYRGWRLYDFRSATREARSAGLALRIDDPLDAMMKDWTSVFSPKMWGGLERTMQISGDQQLAFALGHDLIPRLRPTVLQISGCDALVNLEALGRLDGVRDLSISNCRELETLNGLRATREFTTITVTGCRYLWDVRALKVVPSLKTALFICPLIVQYDYDMLTAALPGVYVGPVTAVGAGWRSVKYYSGRHRWRSEPESFPTSLPGVLDPLQQTVEHDGVPPPAFIDDAWVENSALWSDRLRGSVSR